MGTTRVGREPEAAELRDQAAVLYKVAEALIAEATRKEKAAFEAAPPWRLATVKILTEKGDLSAADYTYRYRLKEALQPGQLVAVPKTKSWMSPVTYAQVQSGDIVGETPHGTYYQFKEIERVVTPSGPR